MSNGHEWCISNGYESKFEVRIGCNLVVDKEYFRVAA